MLETIIKEHVKTPLICTIFGEPGLGKTSLAATFPNPIFVLAEDGLKSVKPRPHSFPLLQSANPLWEQLDSLRKEKHDYKTLVIDTVTQLEILFISHILAADKTAPSFASSHGGYGAPYQMLDNMHGRLRKAAGILAAEKKMNVVFLAHSEIDELNLPDHGECNRYEIKLNKKSRGHYIGNVDLVGFIRLDMRLKKDGKATDSGERVMICHATASNISKNRFGITEPLPIVKNENVLREYCYE